MSILNLLPVSVINLGEATLTETTRTNKGTPTTIKKSVFRFAIFLKQKPDTVFLLDSEGDSDPTIPKFGDIVKLPQLSLLNRNTWESRVNVAAIEKINTLLSSPLAKLENVSSFDLYLNGCFTKQLFGQILANYIGLGSLSVGVELLSLDTDAIIKLCASSVVSNDNALLKAGITKMLNAASAIEPKPENKAQTKAKTTKQTKQNRSIDNPQQKQIKTIDEGVVSMIDTYLNSDPKELNKTQLIEVCRELKLTGYSRKSPVKLRAMIDGAIESATKPENKAITPEVI